MIYFKGVEMMQGKWVHIKSKNDNLVHFWEMKKRFKVVSVIELDGQEDVYFLAHESGDPFGCVIMESEIVEVKEVKV